MECPNCEEINHPKTYACSTCGKALWEKSAASSRQVDEMVSLRMRVDQLERLSEVVSNYDDCGPAGSGWQSEELIELRELIGDCLARVRAG